MKDLVLAFKALSDETRLRILNLLFERECCVCEVTQALEISQTRASRHLNALYTAGFLGLRKDGLWSYYSIDRQMSPQYLLKLVELVNLALVDSPQARRDKQRLADARRMGPGCGPVRNKPVTA